MSQSNHQMNSQNLIYQPSTALLDSPSATSSASCNKQKKIKKHFIDFRSDTVTTPTQKMRKAMFKAAVGDDVYKDDPTVIKLQKYAADLFGKEAALYVPTGCMGNSCGLLGHTNRGQEIICADDCHIIQLERGFVSQVAQLQSRTIDTSLTNGFLTVENIEKCIRKQKNSITEPDTGLIAVEQPTFTGFVYPLERLKQIYELGKSYNIKVHMDGARVFHAAAYLNCDVKEIAQHCDSIQFCLSKGLCAPVGSIIAGTADFIEKCVYIRKLLGGGMRQCGIIAAAGLVALKEQRKFLKKDLEMRKMLEEELEKCEFVQLDRHCDINMIYFKITKEGVRSEELVDFMLESGLKILGCNSDGIYRIMTHYYIGEDEVRQYVCALKEFIGKL